MNVCIYFMHTLQAKLQSDVRQWIVSGIRDSEPSFSNDSMGWLFMECPSGIAPSAAVITGWIYGSEGDLADKYIKGMQKMVDSKAATKVDSQQVCARSCLAATYVAMRSKLLICLLSCRFILCMFLPTNTQLSLDPACTVPLTTLTPPDQACRGSVSSTTGTCIHN